MSPTHYTFPMVVWQMYDPWDRLARLAFLNPTDSKTPHIHDHGVEIKFGLGSHSIRGTKSYWIGQHVVYVEVSRVQPWQPQYLRFDLMDVLGRVLAEAMVESLIKETWMLWQPVTELRRGIPLFHAPRMGAESHDEPWKPNPNYL